MYALKGLHVTSYNFFCAENLTWNVLLGDIACRQNCCFFAPF